MQTDAPNIVGQQLPTLLDVACCQMFSYAQTDATPSKCWGLSGSVCTQLNQSRKVPTEYRKIPKKSPGAYTFQRPFLTGLFLEELIWRGLSTEGNLRFKIDWASLIVEGKFTVFALFYFVFEGNFPNTSPRGLIFAGAI